MTKFIKKLCSRFMTPAAQRGGEVHDIPFKDPLHQLPGEKHNVGFTTRAMLNRLLEAGGSHHRRRNNSSRQHWPFCFMVMITNKSVYSNQSCTHVLLRLQEVFPFHDPKEQDQVSEEFMEYKLMDIALPQDPTVFDVGGDVTCLSSKLESPAYTV
ncbi:uncharacterized protein LOC120557088 [Tachysurus ichikawai]